MKKTILFSLILFLLLNGCTTEENNEKTYQTQQAAIHNIFNQYQISGFIVLIHTTDDQQLFFAENNETFFAGDIKEQEEGFVPRKLTANIALNNTTGATFEIPIEEQDYLLIITSDTKKGSFSVPNSDYYFDLVTEENHHSVVDDFSVIYKDSL
ncbi:hypothetical protein [Gracilibacillus timonensis]|uniref:hypothetical protein n=1 Tax=Gracilibacillus timonensis TaxID=1816696 RepID=UPI00082645FB|nr:hypothetical protein [Gracilibacillus timonensis]